MSGGGAGRMTVVGTVRPPMFQIGWTCPGCGKPMNHLARWTEVVELINGGRLETCCPCCGQEVSIAAGSSSFKDVQGER